MLLCLVGALEHHGSHDGQAMQERFEQDKLDSPELGLGQPVAMQHTGLLVDGEDVDARPKRVVDRDRDRDDDELVVVHTPEGENIDSAHERRQRKRVRGLAMLPFADERQDEDADHEVRDQDVPIPEHVVPFVVAKIAQEL